jgi:glutathione S-transferase
MKLAYSSASPFVRKVDIAADELGLAGRIEHVPTKVAPSDPNREYGKTAPLMKVPSLTLDDGTVLYDSVVICEYLDSVAGGGKLFPASGAARWRVLKLHALANGVLDAAVLARYETFLRPEALRWDAWTQGQLLKIDQGLEDLERSVGELEGIDVAAIAAGCALGYLDFRFAHRDWRGKHPKLAAWFDEISKRESFRKTVPKA